MKRVLIIDDEADICLLLKRFLNKKGFEVEYATEAEAGLKLLHSFRPDIVLCDFRLGKTDGGQVLSQIKAAFPDLPVLIMTGYSDIKVAVNVMKMGAVDYLTKPLFPDEILLSIERTLSQTADNEPEDAPADGAPKAENPKKAKSLAHASGNYIFGNSALSQHLVKQVRLVAPTNYSVIIYGESGSGKEAVAREIHRQSPRADKPFVAMDCGALPPQLAGSELFGHEKGAFTGAVEQKTGHFELANGGTLFLDEVSNLSYEVQISLLRLVQERRLKRIGGTKEIDIDVRIIVASNEKLWDASRSGKFREDLYHRFNEFSIDVPPLRARGSDIQLFSQFFLGQINGELGKNVEGLSREVEQLFQNYPWHGNLRELKNVLKRAVLLCDGSNIQIKDLPFELVNFDKLFFTEQPRNHDLQAAPQPPAVLPVTPVQKPPVSLKDAAMEAESAMILEALQKTNFNKSKAAALLNIDRKTLYNKMKYFNLQP